MLDPKECSMPLKVTWEREEGTLRGQPGDETTRSIAAKLQAALDSTIGLDNNGLILDLEQLTS